MSHLLVQIGSRATCQIWRCFGAVCSFLLQRQMCCGTVTALIFVCILLQFFLTLILGRGRLEYMKCLTHENLKKSAHPFFPGLTGDWTVREAAQKATSAAWSATALRMVLTEWHCRLLWRHSQVWYTWVFLLLWSLVNHITCLYVSFPHIKCDLPCRENIQGWWQ